MYTYKVEAQSHDGWIEIDTLEVDEHMEGHAGDEVAIDLLLSYKEQRGGGPYRLLQGPGVPSPRLLFPDPRWVTGIPAGWRFRAIQF